MANLKSAIKRVRINEKKRNENQVFKTRARNLIAKVDELISENNIEEAEKTYNEMVSAIDRAVQKGTIHKNFGNRHKSRLAKKIKAAKE